MIPAGLENGGLGVGALALLLAFGGRYIAAGVQALLRLAPEREGEAAAKAIGFTRRRGEEFELFCHRVEIGLQRRLEQEQRYSSTEERALVAALWQAKRRWKRWT